MKSSEIGMVNRFVCKDLWNLLFNKRWMFCVFLVVGFGILVVFVSIEGVSWLSVRKIMFYVIYIRNNLSFNDFK